MGVLLGGLDDELLPGEARGLKGGRAASPSVTLRTPPDGGDAAGMLGGMLVANSPGTTKRIE